MALAIPPEIPAEFPAVIDSTLIAAWDSCETKAYRTYLQHWKRHGESIHLVAGAAYASGLETARRAFWERGASREDALAEGIADLLAKYGSFEYGERDTKTPDRMAGALEFYFSECPMTRGGETFSTHDGVPFTFSGTGKRGIEFSFAEPLDIRHPETGDPLILTGRADMVVEWADGIYIWDDKTASQLGSSWAQQWDLRSQFTAYTWAAKRAGIPVKGVIANGVSILKTKYGRERALTYRANWELERWYENMLKKLERMIAAWKTNSYILNLNESCASYGGCSLRDICKAQNPTEWIHVDFERRRWDPMLRQEFLLPSTVEA